MSHASAPMDRSVPATSPRRGRARRARRRAAVAWLLTLGVVLTARADGEPILHEYIPHVAEDEALHFGGGDAPSAIVYDGEVLLAPEATARAPGEAAMQALPGDGQGTEEAGRRSPQFRPDRLTSLDQSLRYYNVFAPSVMPHKRVTSLDRVTIARDGTPVLTVDPNAGVQRVEVGTQAGDGGGAGRDRFWGSVVLDFSGGPRVPLPSVSPEARLLTVETNPPSDLRFERDGAGNYYAVAPAGSGVRGEVRLVFLTDADRGYFNRELPDPAIPVDVRADEVAPLPADVSRHALEFAAELGLHPSSSLREALEVLTRHFRSFEETDGSLPTDGDIYSDIAIGMRGVCRHRAYAFVITAMALGIPARFMMNEAHAWVEVAFGEVGFMRVDLGGAAAEVQRQGDPRTPPYEPRARDPLPQPASYLRSSARGQGASGSGPTGAGEGDASSAGGPAGVDGADGAAQGAAGEPGAAPGSASDGAAAADPNGPVDGSEPTSLGPPGAEGASEREGPAAAASVDGTDDGGLSESPPKQPLTIGLRRRQYATQRGRPIEVSGRVRSPDGTGVAGLRVEVLLSGRQEALLGVVVTGAQGAFQTNVTVPHDLAVGEYRLLVRTPGNDAYEGALAE